MWNIAICDNQPESITDIKDKLLDMAIMEIGAITVFLDGKSMLADMEDGLFSADIVIMDIELGNCNGIDLASDILDIRPDCQIIFISGYDDYYERVYDVSHIYFIKKPVNADTLKKALLKAIEALNMGRSDFFAVQTKSGNHIIPYRDIYSFERDKRKINIIGRNGETLCSYYGRLDDISHELPIFFVRCHNSIFVNMALAKSLENNCFVMRDDRAVAISRSHKTESKLAFAKYLTGNL